MRVFWIAPLLAACSSSPIDDPNAQPGDAGPAPDADATPADAPDADATDADGATGANRTHYPHGPLHSPLSAGVQSRLRAVVDGSPHRKDVFAKIGDSHTVSVHALHCFAGSDVKLGAHEGLEPTRQFFKKTLVDGARTSFDRTTLAAAVGWGAGKTIAGDPSPIEQEVAAIRPAFGVVLLGTNDTYATGVHPFERTMRRVVEELVALGVVPLLTTIPQRTDSAEAASLVPEMNAVLRAVAQYERVPLVDLFSALAPLDGFGLASDGVHLQVHASGGARGCWLTPEALAKGMNQRNLVTLQALDRLRRFVLEGAPPEPDHAIAGGGSWAAPWVVDALPFSDHGSTATSTVDVVDKYPCGSQDESGPEVVYRLDLSAPTRLRIRAFADDGVDVDLHWLDGEAPSTCTARADRLLDVDASAGTHRIVVDTFVTAGAPKSGAFRLTVVERK